MTDRRALILITIIFSLFYLLLFTPWNGGGCDGVFYYSYLSSVFHDGDINFLNDLYRSNNEIDTILSLTFDQLTARGYLANPYAVGAPILWLPFYLIAFLLAKIGILFGGQLAMDRFSFLFLLTISLATLFYGYLAVILIYRICRFWYAELVCFWATIGACFASPLLAYLFKAPDVAHVNSAFSVALFVYLCLRHQDLSKTWDYVLIGLSAGLMMLVRWQNGVFLLIFALIWLQKFIRETKREGYINWSSTGRFFISLAVVIAVSSMQMVIWLALYGRLVTVPQGPDYIHWGSPAIIQLLSSGWHGLYYWSPLLLPATVGLFLHFRQDKMIALAFLVCFGIMVYINSIVTDWWAFASFGARRFCNTIPVLAIGMAAVINLGYRKRTLFILFKLAIVLSIIFNFVLVIFYHRRIVDIYFFNHLLLLKDILFKSLTSYPLYLFIDSYPFYLVYLQGKFLTALMVVVLGLGIIWGGYLLFAAKRLRFVENYKSCLIVLAILLAFGWNVFVLLGSPREIADGKLIIESMNQLKARNSEPARQLLFEAMHNAPDNPIPYMLILKHNLAEDESKIASRLQIMAPKLGCKFSLTTAEKYINQEALKYCLNRYYQDEPLNFHLIDFLIRQQDFSAASQRLEQSRLSVGLFYRLQAQLMMSENYRRQATKAYKRMLRFIPTSTQALSQLAICYRLRGKEAKAKFYTHQSIRVLELHIKNVNYYRRKVSKWFQWLAKHEYFWPVSQLGELYTQNGQIDRALALYEEAMAMPGCPESLRQKKVVLTLRQALTVKSEIEADKLLKQHPSSPEIYSEVINYYFSSGDLQRAINVALAGFRKFPADFGIAHYFNLNLIRYQDDIGEDLLRNLIQQDIRSAYFKLAVGELLIRQKRFEQAIPLLTEAISIDDTIAWSYFNLAVAHFELGHYEEAAAQAKKAMIIDPAYLTYQLLYARAAVRSGQRNEALTTLSAILENNPDCSEAKELKQQLLKMKNE